VWALPEGRLVLAGEPLLEVTAPITEAQLVETALLNLSASRPRWLQGGPLGVRLDSGDLGALAVQTQRRLDAAGLPQVRIVASGGLDEFSIAELVAYGGRPVMKLSPGKGYPPGAKQVFRGPAGGGDLVGLREEPAPGGRVPLLEPVMVGGRRVGPPPELAVARERFEADLAWLPARRRPGCWPWSRSSSASRPPFLVGSASGWPWAGPSSGTRRPI
jgi:nicotinic acid phosphoribosyltransferase